MVAVTLVLVLKQRCFFMGFSCVEITYMSTYVRKFLGDVSKPGLIHPCIIVCKSPAGASLLGVGAISWRVLDMVFVAIHLDVVM
jgi:hypothetical protein